MIIIKKRTVLIISALVLTLFTFIICFNAISSLGVGEASKNGIKIVLDAGHGGIDCGCVGTTTGVKESELNLSIVKKILNLLSDSGFSVVLTRSTDAGLYGMATRNLKKKDMKKRAEIINDAKPDLVVSIHQNKFSSSSRSGAQVFFSKENDNSRILANYVQNSFNTMKQSKREYKALSADYYILNCSNYPTIIAECGFLSNPEDEKNLITDEYQSDLAYAIYKGILQYLSESAHGSPLFYD